LEFRIFGGWLSFTISLPYLYHITGREGMRVDIRRVSIAGEQFLCGGRAVSYQRAKEAERQKNSILSDKVATFPVYFKFVSNRGGGELHF
jgi:hypothetical protein